MSTSNQPSMDGKLMTNKEAEKAFDRKMRKGRKIMRILGGNWVSFDEQTLKTTTDGQTETTTDGRTTLMIKGRQLKLVIRGKDTTIGEKEWTSGGETPTYEWVNEYTAWTTEEQATVTGQATATGQEMMTEQVAPTGQGTTSDEGTKLSDEKRLSLFNFEQNLLRTGRDKTTTDGRMTLSTVGQVTDEQAMGMTVEQMTGTVEQSTSKRTDEQMTMTEGRTDEQVVDTIVMGQTTIMGTDEQLMTTVVEEMVVEVDPLALSPSASVVDPLALSPAPSVEDLLAPSLSVPVVAGSDSEMGHYSVVDTLPASPAKVDQEADVVDLGTDILKSPIGAGRKVVGRSRPVVMDEDSDMSIVCVSSADEDYSAATSSSRPGRGIKRGRKPVKGKGKVDTGNSEDGKMKKERKKKEMGRKDTPEEEESAGIYGEPKGIVDQELEDMSSEVLGGAIQNWADTIEDVRVKSKNMQGRLSGELKRSVAKIKEGTALLVARSTASGDPEFLRMRNTELEAQLQEAKREIVRLQVRLEKSPELPSPPRKKKKEGVKRADVADVASADLADSVDSSSHREAFPPLPQRAPRVGVAQDGSVKKKVGPRIVSDIQVAQPFRDRREQGVAIPAVPGAEAEWRVAVGSRRRGRVKGDKPPLPPPPPPVSSEGRPPPTVRRQQPKVKLPRPPRSSAVMITGKAEGFSYAEVMKNAREHISLENLGITTSRVRKALNGGMLIEVSGEDSRSKAEELVMKLRDVLKDSAAVSCPVKKRELTVVGFDESVSSGEIVEALSNIGECPKDDIKIGPIRTMNSGLGMVWVQLPVAAAAKAAEQGRIRVGWTIARVELLKVRPLQCYKCWSFGHVQTACRSIVDRRGACFRCGQKGHVAGACTNPVHCAVCHDAGVEASHRLGGPQCAAQERQGAK